MAANKPSKEAILAAFFDEGNYSPLFTDGAVSAAFGCANGQSVYAVYQNGEPVGAADLDKTTRVLKMAAETGNPVVTFYNSTGAKLEGGLELLNANSRLTAEIARISGVVPQVAVVTGTCAGTSAVQAAAADVCIMAADAELFLTAPFNAEDKVKAAGSAEFAAKAGVAAIVEEDAVKAASAAARVVGMLPANNLAGPAVFDFEAPAAALNLVKYDAKSAAEAIADAGSLTELYAGYGRNIYTALGSVNGQAVGIVATAKGTLCHKCTAKAARFVRLCDAYSIPVVTVVNTEGFVKSEGDDRLAASARLPVWLAFMPKLPPLRSRSLPVRLLAPSTPSLQLPLTGVLLWTAAPLPRWHRKPPLPFCTRTRSLLLTTSSRLPSRRLLPTRQSSAAQLPLLPTALLMPL